MSGDFHLPRIKNKSCFIVDAAVLCVVAWLNCFELQKELT